MIPTGCILVVTIFLSTKQGWIMAGYQFLPSLFSPFQHVIILVQWTLTARPIAWQTRPKLTHISSAISHCFNEKPARQRLENGENFVLLLPPVILKYWTFQRFKWVEIMLQCKERVEVNNHHVRFKDRCDTNNIFSPVISKMTSRKLMP